MNIKRISIIITIFALAITGTMAVSAQEDAPADRPERGRQIIGSLVGLVVNETGLTPEQIRAELLEGATLEEIIINNDGSVEAVIGAALEQVTIRVEEAIVNGNMTEERGAAILSEIEARLSEALNRAFEPNGERRDRIHERIGELLNRSLLRRAMSELGMERAEFIQAMVEGGSLESVLITNGVDVEIFKHSVITDIETRINEAIESGQLTTEQGETLLEGISEAIDARLSHEFENRPRRHNASDGATTGA